jgi:hypothetical protein
MGEPDGRFASVARAYRRRAIPSQARVVYQHIQRAEPGAHLFENGYTARFLRKARRRYDVQSILSQYPGGGAANPAGCTGDDGELFSKASGLAGIKSLSPL